MTEITDDGRLAADGVPVELAGNTYRFRFAPRAMRDMEERYGSLKAVGEMLANFESQPLYGTVYYLMSLALRHQRVVGGEEFEAPGGVTIRERLTEDWLLDNTDANKVHEYARLVFEALMQALPGAAIRKPDDENPSTPPASSTLTPTAPNGSPGAASSGSPSPSATSLPSSSGTT